ncbi:MAG: hypothetical protein IKH07_08020 [Oscillospiraceae bacterium]|nr:hypothetical protein [Oscillospiraceae bacterium]
MYSRYIPNESGGFDRRRVQESRDQIRGPDAPARRAAGPESAERGEQDAEPGRRTARPAPPRPGGHDPPSRPPRPQMGPSGPPPRPQMGPPPRPRPGPPGPRFPASGFLGPEGLLGRLLPRGLDAEELLILAVLLLAMKQDGAGSTELLIAAALYLLL